MKLMLVGRAGTRVCDWRSYTLLRDNVQHFVESGVPSSDFEALHLLERAVDEGSALVDAMRLRTEVLRAWCALWKVRLESAAIGLRTRAVLAGCAGSAAAEAAVSAASSGWRLNTSSTEGLPVPQVARRFVRIVLLLTEAATDGDMLQVRCVADGPRFSRRFERATASLGAGRV